MRKRPQRKNLCPACGYENADDALFCNRCGTRLTEPAAAEKPKRKASAQSETANGWTWRKIVELCGGIFALCGVFCVLLCTFLLGVTVKGLSDFSGLSDYFSQFGATESQNIYYYFRDAYDDISQALTALGYYSGTLELSLYLSAIFGTVIAAGTIVSVVTLSVLAAVRYGLKTAGKSEKDYAPYAAAAILAFVIGSILLYAINAVTVSVLYKSSSESESFHASLALNGAGVAGIVCGLVCLGVFLACRVAQKGKELGTKESVLKLCFTAGALALIGIILGFSGMPGITATQVSSASYFRQTLTLKMSLLTGGTFLATQAEASTSLPEPSGEYLLTMFAQIAQLAVVILAGIALIFRVNHLSSDKKRSSGLPLAIALAAGAVVYLVLDIIAVGRMWEFLETMADFTPNYAYAIVVLVFSVVNLAATIVYKVLGCKKQTA